MASTSSITSNEGITWEFASNVNFGQYCTGDYWVVGPVLISSVSPSSEYRADGTQKNGSMFASQITNEFQGFDGLATFHIPFLSSLNAENYIGETTPIALSPGDRLISVSCADSYPPIKLASVLTCVSAIVEEANPLRPGYTDSSKDYISTSSFSGTIWNSLLLGIDLTSYLTKSFPTSAAVLSSVSSFWFDAYEGVNARIMRPGNSMETEDTDIAAIIGNVALFLNVYDASLNKFEILSHLVQKGIDNYSNLVNLGRRWAYLGPEGASKKFSILFAGYILNDADMLAVGTDYATVLGGPNAFPEDNQTFVVASGASGINYGYGDYAASDIGLPEWGLSHWELPEYDNVEWVDTTLYGQDSRRFFAMKNWIGYLFTTKILGLQELWNHPVLFDYFNRYYAKEIEIADEVAASNIKESLAPADFEWNYDYVSSFNSSYFNDNSHDKVEGIGYLGISNRSNILLYASSFNTDDTSVDLVCLNPLTASGHLLVGSSLHVPPLITASGIVYVKNEGAFYSNHNYESSLIDRYTAFGDTGRFYVQAVWCDSSNNVIATSNVVIVDSSQGY